MNTKLSDKLFNDLEAEWKRTQAWMKKYLRSRGRGGKSNKVRHKQNAS